MPNSETGNQSLSLSSRTTFDPKCCRSTLDTRPLSTVRRDHRMLGALILLNGLGLPHPRILRSTRKFNSTPCDELLASTTAPRACRQALQTPPDPAADTTKQAKMSAVEKTMGQKCNGLAEYLGFRGNSPMPVDEASPVKRRSQRLQSTPAMSRSNKRKRDVRDATSPPPVPGSPKRARRQQQVASKPRRKVEVLDAVVITTVPPKYHLNARRSMEYEVDNQRQGRR